MNDPISDLINRLETAGATGSDMSPGDALNKEAAVALKTLQTKLADSDQSINNDLPNVVEITTGNGFTYKPNKLEKEPARVYHVIHKVEPPVHQPTNDIRCEVLPNISTLIDFLGTLDPSCIIAIYHGVAVTVTTSKPVIILKDDKAAYTVEIPSNKKDWAYYLVTRGNA